MEQESSTGPHSHVNSQPLLPINGGWKMSWLPPKQGIEYNEHTMSVKMGEPELNQQMWTSPHTVNFVLVMSWRCFLDRLLCSHLPVEIWLHALSSTSRRMKIQWTYFSRKNILNLARTLTLATPHKRLLNLHTPASVTDCMLKYDPWPHPKHLPLHLCLPSARALSVPPKPLDGYSYKQFLQRCPCKGFALWFLAGISLQWHFCRNCGSYARMFLQRNLCSTNVTQHLLWMWCVFANAATHPWCLTCAELPLCSWEGR
jgi:hypothetical protein